MSSTILVLKIRSWMMIAVIRMCFYCYLQSHYLWGWISPKLVPSSEKMAQPVCCHVKWKEESGPESAEPACQERRRVL